MYHSSQDFYASISVCNFEPSLECEYIFAYESSLQERSEMVDVPNELTRARQMSQILGYSSSQRLRWAEK